MFNGAAVKMQKQCGSRERLLESCLNEQLAWQGAKKGLSHSPYVIGFPGMSAGSTCQQTPPAEGLGVLRFSHFKGCAHVVESCDDESSQGEQWLLFLKEITKQKRSPQSCHCN